MKENLNKNERMDEHMIGEHLNQVDRTTQKLLGTARNTQDRCLQQDHESGTRQGFS